MKLDYSCETVDQTRLLKFYLKAVSVSRDHFPLVHHFVSDLNIHITKYGVNTKHPKYTCSTIYDYLVSIEAPEQFTLSPSQSSFKTTHNNFHPHRHNRS